MREYKAFISYRHKPLDIAVATRLHRLIEHFRIPAEFAGPLGNRRFGYVFRDQDELPVSSDLSANIREALDRSEYLIVVCTPQTPKSMWVEREIRYFLEHHDRNHILAVLADGTPEEAFPTSLVHIFDEAGNIVGDAEPLAANIVDASSDRWRVLRRLDRESLRIFAALIGCPYDALFQRERRYRARRLAAIGGIALTVALACIGLLTAKNRQITRQNEALTEQKRLIQLSESRLLAEDAGRALESGDRVTAMRKALEALPESAEDTRPYWADAERVLIASTGVCDPGFVEQPLIDSKTIEMLAPLRDAEFDRSGARLFAVDEYCNLVAIDSGTGGVLWQSYVVRDVQSRPYFVDMRLHEKQGCVILATDQQITCLEIADGGVRWSYQPEFGMIEVLSLDTQNDLFACMEQVALERKEGSFSSDYELAVFRASTGELLRRIPVVQNVKPLNVYVNRNVYEISRIQNGRFFNGGKSFAGAYSAGPFSTDHEYVFFCVDLEAEASHTLAALASDLDAPLMHLDVSPGEDALIAFQRCKETDRAVEIRRISLTDGSIIASEKSPAEEEEPFYSRYLDYRVDSRGDTLLLSVGNFLYAVDPQTCACYAGTSFTDTVTSLQWVSDYTFGITLADGFYAIGWLTVDDEFCDTRELSTTFHLGANSHAMLGGGGFMRILLDGNQIRGVDSGAPEDGFGYAVIRPEGNYRTLRIEKLLRHPGISPWETTGAPEEGLAVSRSFDISAPCMQIFRDKALLIEHAYIDENSLDQFAWLDLETHEVVQRTRLPSFDSDYLDRWPFSDGSGLLEITPSFGAISKLDFGSDESVVLTEASEEVVSVHDDVSIMDYSAEASFCYLSADSRLLSAWCDNTQLRWWLDGEEQAPVPLPKELTWQVVSTKYYRQIFVTPFGLILLSHYGAGDSGNRMEGFFAYDTRTGAWLKARDVAHGNSDRLTCGGTSSPVIGVMDDDGMLRVYDMAAGALSFELPVNRPLESVRTVQFALEDRFILLGTQDNQILIYSLETGECVFHSEFENSRGTLQMDLDRAGRRVVVICPYDRTGIILDRESWTELARLERVYAFDPARDELYCDVYSGGSSVCYRRIPDLWELSAAVRASVGEPASRGLIDCVQQFIRLFFRLEWLEDYDADWHNR